MRIMPFMKRKKGVQFAGIGFDVSSGGGGGGGDTSPFEYVVKEYTSPTSSITLSDVDISRLLAITGVAKLQNDYVPFNTYISGTFFASAYVANTASGVKLYLSSSGSGIDKAQVIFILKKEV